MVICLLGFVMVICGCGRDEVLELTPDENIVQEVICDSLMVLKAEPEVLINYNSESHALLFKSTCEDFNADFPPRFNFNYLVLGAEWDSWGTDRPVKFCDVLDGLPGIPGIPFGSVATFNVETYWSHILKELKVYTNQLIHQLDTIPIN